MLGPDIPQGKGSRAVARGHTNSHLQGITWSQASPLSGSSFRSQQGECSERASAQNQGRPRSELWLRHIPAARLHLSSLASSYSLAVAATTEWDRECESDLQNPGHRVHAQLILLPSLSPSSSQTSESAASFCFSEQPSILSWNSTPFQSGCGATTSPLLRCPQISTRVLFIEGFLLLTLGKQMHVGAGVTSHKQEGVWGSLDHGSLRASLSFRK